MSTKGRKLSIAAITVLAGSIAAVASAGRSNCWMTGGGSVFRANGTEVTWSGPRDGRVTHGFELRCEGNPNNLEINWKDDAGNAHRFHLQNLTSAVCTDSPAIEPNPPDAQFDTYAGTGTGRYDGTSGALAEWVFTDAGEGGSGDTASILITFNGNVVLDVTGFLTFGNHQAHSN